MVYLEIPLKDYKKKIKASYEFWVFVHKYRVKNESKK